MSISPSIETMANFTEILKNEPKKAYDFIANYGHLFDKNELINIIKELIYGMHVSLLDSIFENTMLNIGIELDDQYDEAYQEE